MLEVVELTRPGLNPVSFRVDKGECLAVRGASGSGKSLLLRAIADLDPNEGRVFLNGNERSGMPASRWRRLVGYVPAETGWWADSVEEHFADWSTAEPLIHRLELPIGTRDWAISRLSTGEKQRLALARALNLSPSALLLDEPTSGLDAEAEAAVENLVAEKIHNGLTVLWVTHSGAQARRVAHRFLKVDNGTVHEEPA